MSKSWSEVIENIDLSIKPLREPRKLSCDEITDLKEKCNPKYDLTILDLICTIESLQQENEQLRAKRDKGNEQLRAQVTRMKESEVEEG
jgi:FtsZ-binding cell division protein ZapB